jgi:mannose-1-phosphate guanylyltransferase
MNRTYPSENVWSIILAGGEGERLRPLVQEWLGRHKPKQYCTFVGTRSMFQHTLDRADQITAPARRVTVIAESHQSDAVAQLAGRNAGEVILQPTNRGTAAGIFLALTHVRMRNPDAVVVIYPSDHFVYPEDRFLKAIRGAVQAAEQMKHRLFLLGVTPDRPEPDYGWIYPGDHLTRIDGHSVWAVRRFLEKPSFEICSDAMAEGALWNTLILTARVEHLWTLGWRCFPEMMSLFETYGKSIGTSQESVLEAVYKVMPSRDFSTDLLQQVPDQVGVIKLTGTHWFDWGKPERFVETLDRLGRQPAFSSELVSAL